MTPTSVELATSRNVHGESSSSRTDVVTGGSRVIRGRSRHRDDYVSALALLGGCRWLHWISDIVRYSLESFPMLLWNPTAQDLCNAECCVQAP